MKQAILITAYKNVNHLVSIINFFDDNFEVYIHFDKKSLISKEALYSLKKFSIVKLVSQKYNVYWGGINHLKSILYLSSEALKNKDIKRFHLISGHDFPIKNQADFLSFFGTSQSNYIECFEVPFKGWTGNGGLDRLNYFSFYDLLNWKNPFHRKIIKKIISFQKKIDYKRKSFHKKLKLYGGSTWWSLERECLDYIIKFTKQNHYVLKRFKHTFCSEEFYFQTIIMNSNFKSSVVNKNLRYIDWSNRNGNNPSILDESDVKKIETSESFFARRFEYPTSVKLIEKIKSKFS